MYLSHGRLSPQESELLIQNIRVSHDATKEIVRAVSNFLVFLFAHSVGPSTYIGFNVVVVGCFRYTLHPMYMFVCKAPFRSLFVPDCLFPDPTVNPKACSALQDIYSIAAAPRRYLQLVAAIVIACSSGPKYPTIVNLGYIGICNCSMYTLKKEHVPVTKVQ